MNSMFRLPVMRPIDGRIIWPVFLLTVLVQPLGSVFYFLILGDSSVVQAVYSLTKLLMLAAPVALPWLGLRLGGLSLGQRVPESVMLGVCSGLLISGTILGVFELFQSSFVSLGSGVTAKVEAFGMMEYYVLAAVAFSIFHSLFEEYFWRWYVVGGLMTRLGATSAILLGGLLFSLHHYVILSQFFSLGLTLLFGTLVGVGGVIWSLLWQRTDSLLGPWISHALVDGTLFWVGWMVIG